MKKIILTAVVVLVIIGAINGVNTAGTGNSAALRAFQNAPLCRDLNVAEFVELFAEPGTVKWQDGSVEHYGEIVGFIAGMSMKDPTHKGYLGMQLNYRESPIEEGAYQFTPVAMEMGNSTTGETSTFPTNNAMMMLKQLCESEVQSQKQKQ